jgi:uncharacterized protein YciI
MSIHLCKLLPPRPTFPADISEAEATLMREHAAYWNGLTERGIAVVFGPVFDPAGVWGCAIVEVADGTAPSTLTEDDPVIRSACGFRYEIYPMPQAIVRASVQP